MNYILKEKRIIVIHGIEDLSVAKQKHVGEYKTAPLKELFYGDNFLDFPHYSNTLLVVDDEYRNQPAIRKIIVAAMHLDISMYNDNTSRNFLEKTKQALLLCNTVIIIVSSPNLRHILIDFLMNLYPGSDVFVRK